MTPESIAQANGLWAVEDGAWADLMAGRYSRWSMHYAESERFRVLPETVLALPVHGGMMIQEYAGLAHLIQTRRSNVHTILLHVVSQGGMVAGLWDLCNAVYEARQAGVTVVAMCEGMVASAAYAIASQADTIIVDQGCTVGSIGVRAMHANQKGMLEKIGVELTTLVFGDHKDDGSPFEPLSSTVQARWQAEVNRNGEIFLDTVARGRNGAITRDAAKATQAQTYNAFEAQDMGLVDAVGTTANLIAALSAPSTPLT